MKIMRSDSWRPHWPAGAACETMRCGMHTVSLRKPTGVRVVHCSLQETFYAMDHPDRL